MISAYTTQNGQAIKVDFSNKNIPYFWIDLCNPTSDEIVQVETHFNLQLPSQNICDGSISNRCFKTNDVCFMTLLTSEDNNVLLALKDKILITAHSYDLVPFYAPLNTAATAEEALLFLIKTFVQNVAEKLEIYEKKTLQLSEEICHYPRNAVSGITQATNGKEIATVAINDIHTSVMICRRSLISIRLLVDFSSKCDIKILEQTQQCIDVMIEHTNFISDQLSFLQSTLLNYIGIKQATLQTSSSVFSTLFIVPALVMAFFSMDFNYMPSLLPLLQVNCGLFFVLAVIITGTYLLYRYIHILQFA